MQDLWHGRTTQACKMVGLAMRTLSPRRTAGNYRPARSLRPRQKPRLEFGGTTRRRQCRGYWSILGWLSRILSRRLLRRLWQSAKTTCADAREIPRICSTLQDPAGAERQTQHTFGIRECNQPEALAVGRRSEKRGQISAIIIIVYE